MKIVATAAAASIVAGLLFLWGMAVGQNDMRTFAALDARSEMQARAICGVRATVLRSDGDLRCVYVDPVGGVVTRPVIPTLGIVSD